MNNKSCSEETKRKISNSRKGKGFWSEERKKRFIELMKGNKNPNYGKHLSEEAKKNISEKLKGNIPWNKGKKNPYSEEVNKKRLENLKKYYDKKDYNCKKINKQGYVEIYIPSNSKYFEMRNKNSYRWILEHRLIMAQHLGRCLESWEIIHHINEIKTDNRIENLEILEPKKHINFHFQNKLMKKEIKELRELLLILILCK